MTLPHKTRLGIRPFPQFNSGLHLDFFKNSPIMTSEVALLLICVFFSKAFSLTCIQCPVDALGTCKDDQVTCPDQCLAATVSVYMSGTKLTETNIKTCGMPEMCESGSINLGMMKVSNNAKCCKTDLCNRESIPAFGKQSPNGRICYTCNANSCTQTVRCEGDENYCISASVQQGSNTVSMKGCVTKNYCAASGTANTGIGISSVKCCDGNLCNGAKQFTLNFLLMIVPLLPSTLFY